AADDLGAVHPDVGVALGHARARPGIDVVTAGTLVAHAAPAAAAPPAAGLAATVVFLVIVGRRGGFGRLRARRRFGPNGRFVAAAASPAATATVSAGAGLVGAAGRRAHALRFHPAVDVLVVPLFFVLGRDGREGRAGGDDRRRLGVFPLAALGALDLMVGV